MKKRNQCRKCWFSAEPAPAINCNRQYWQSLFSMLFFVVFLFGCIKPAAAQIAFDKHEINIGSAKRQTVLTGFLLGGKVAEIAVVKIDENNERHLRIYSFDNRKWLPKLETKLRNGVQFVDVVNIGGQDRLITYEPGHLNWFDPESATERELVAVKTDFSSTHKNNILHINISRDLNGDKLDDLIIPDAEGFSVFIQIKDGAFAKPVKIGTPPKTDMYRYDPWSQGRIHEIDYNRDGHGDLVYWDTTRFQVHLQNEDGLFSESAETFTTGVQFDSDDINTLAAPNGVLNRRKDTQPEGKLTGRVLHSLTDINGDGVADLVVFSLQGGSLWKMYSNYEVYFGTPTSESGTAFDQKIDAVVRVDGIPFGVEKHDFDSDGQSDVMFTTINPGFFKVARMLVGWVFTRSVSLDVKFYKMEDDVYSAKPTAKRKVKTVSLGGSGENAAKFPAILFGDVNGDKRSDLLVQKGKKELQIFTGVPKPYLFSNKSQKIKTVMPKNKRYIWLKDLNNDGKQDILIYHTPAKSPHWITILIVR